MAADHLHFDLDQAKRLANELYEANRARIRNKQFAGVVKEFKKKVVDKTNLPDKVILFNKQNGMCGLCHLPVKFELATIDHIVPKSKGGSSKIGNKQLTHSLCNNVKGDSVKFISPSEILDRVSNLKEKVSYKRKSKKNVVVSSLKGKKVWADEHSNPEYWKLVNDDARKQFASF